MPLLVRRYIQAVTGITMIGIGVAFNYMANLGLGPWGVLHDGISKTINITYGQAGIMTSLISLLLWIPLTQKPGIATIFDAFWIGLTADFVINMIPDAPSLVFQIKVWKEISKIPYGETRTYKDLAIAIGRPNSSRAVANACGKNPYAPTIPCHRVVRSDGKLGGYSGDGGIATKKRLLEEEQK